MAELMAIDIETYSDISLPDCGVHCYVSSAQFESLLFAYSIDDGEIAVIDLASGDEMPEEVMECLKDDSVIKTAFNAAFERTCINRYFHLDLQPESWELFKTYCIRDVAVEMQIRKKLQKFPIPDKEQELYCMDVRSFTLFQDVLFPRKKL